jgi:hypothetical protein
MCAEFQLPNFFGHVPGILQVLAETGEHIGIDAIDSF